MGTLALFILLALSVSASSLASKPVLEAVYKAPKSLEAVYKAPKAVSTKQNSFRNCLRNSS